MTNEEMLLRALMGEELAVTEFHPQTNKQAYLAYAVGLLTDPDALPAPRTNEEALLMQVCLNGSGGVELPELTNPAEAYEILAGKEAIDQNGQVIIGLLEVGGDDITFTDATYLFYDNARVEVAEDLLKRMPYITNAYSMFSKATNLNLSELLTNGFFVKLKKSQDCTYMFWTNNQLKSFPDIQFENQVALGCMFKEAVFLESVGNIQVPSLRGNLQYSDFEQLFYGCKRLKTVGDISVEDSTRAVECNHMFYNASDLESVGAINCKIAAAASMFEGCSNLKEVPQLDISECTTMSSLFSGCSKLKGTINLGKHKATSVGSVFKGCKNLEEIVDFHVSCTGAQSSGNTFPSGSATSPYALRKLTFHPESSFTGFYGMSITHCAFGRDAMAEFFNSLPDITGTTAGANYTKISITGNPCVMSEIALAKETYSTTFSSYEEFCDHARLRYRGFDHQNAPIKYGIGGHAVSTEATFTDIAEDMFSGQTVSVQFQADTIVIPEEVKLTDADRAIATNKGWTLVE